MAPTPTLLAFDTSGPFCAAALLQPGGKITTRVEEMARGQGERLMLLLEEMLAEGGIAWSDLDGIGVGVGPGNFTGIRISVSAARGLALAIRKPAVGVSGFEAAAYAMENVIICLPAPRDQVYMQLRIGGVDPEPKLVDLTKSKTIPRWPARAEPRFVGPAAEETARACLGRTFSPSDLRAQPVAAIDAIAWTAAARLRHTTERPTPLYVKPPDAAPSREAPPVILP